MYAVNRGFKYATLFNNKRPQMNMYIWMSRGDILDYETMTTLCALRFDSADPGCEYDEAGEWRRGKSAPGKKEF